MDPAEVGVRGGVAGPVPAARAAGPACPDGAQPQPGSARVPRGPATPPRTPTSADDRDYARPRVCSTLIEP